MLFREKRIKIYSKELIVEIWLVPNLPTCWRLGRPAAQI